MGTKFEVLIWIRTDAPDNVNSGYRNVSVWCGESVLKALMELRKAKKRTGCATLKWRG
jgi:hypothetical protein